MDGDHEKKSHELLMMYVGCCDGKSRELCWLLWSSVAVLKKTKKLNVTTKYSVWTKYKTKRFPLPLDSLAPSLDGVHEKKSPKLIMTYVGSCDGKSGELCWIFLSSIAVLKEKKI